MFHLLCDIPMPTRSAIGSLRVALLDDHALVRKGLEAELAKAPEIVLVGSYGSSVAFRNMLKSMPVDVALIDYSLGHGDMDGLALVKQLVAAYPSLKILIVSAYDDGVMVGNLINAGASGFVAKSREPEEIIRGIKEVHKGEQYLAYTQTVSKKLPAIALLSPKEYEVARYIAEGKLIKEIAEMLNKSVKTVSSQKTSVQSKLGVKNDVELLRALIPHFESIGRS